MMKSSSIARGLSGFLKTAFMAGGSRGISNIRPPVNVAITGGAGAIGYALMFRIARGDFLGPDQPINLHLIEVPAVEKMLDGVKMELIDCAFPLLNDIITTSDYKVGFGDCDYAFLVGAKPRGPGMERGDLIMENGPIFVGQGKALSDNAKKTVKVGVVGNPANTNALIALHNAPNLNASNFSAMTRLDHNRAMSQIALKCNSPTRLVEKVAIWGNHSPSMYPDLNNTTVDGKLSRQIIGDDKWVETEFIPTVQKRGAAVIEARKSSSAASAANGVLDHMRDWIHGSNGKWVSMAVLSEGEYDGMIESGLIFSYPCVTDANGLVSKQLPKLTAACDAYMKKTLAELKSERDLVKKYLS
eukprot:Filipodium_phascolosomae@DN5854_c0_g1_i1.p1